MALEAPAALQRMRHRPRVASLAAALAAVTHPIAAEDQTVHTCECAPAAAPAYQYLLHLPRDYASTGSASWPLLVFLHGSGERGSDPWLVATHGPPKLLRRGTPVSAGETAEARALRERATELLATRFIVVSPQCPALQAWETRSLLAVIDEVASRHAINPRRIYLTGLSMGGFGAWTLALRHPERFAAVAPICGGGNWLDFYFARLERNADLVRLPFWVFHGGKDPTVAPEESARLVQDLRQAGVKEVRFTVYPEATHDSWTQTYANPELYHWLLAQQR